MLDLSDIKITLRDEQVLHLLVEGCSNKEIAEQLNISPRTVKQHLRMLFLRAGIKDGRKHVKLRTTHRSTTNQAHRAGHLGPSAALSACIERNSEHNFSSSTFVPQPPAQQERVLRMKGAPNEPLRSPVTLRTLFPHKLGNPTTKNRPGRTF
jgi:IS30 family transposase